VRASTSPVDRPDQLGGLKSDLPFAVQARVLKVVVGRLADPPVVSTLHFARHRGKDALWARGSSLLLEARKACHVAFFGLRHYDRENPTRTNFW
jgi:hypothetical protein